ncbi:MAG: hypothetical protein ACPG49_10040 [Chitinophagales bacterium]
MNKIAYILSLVSFFVFFSACQSNSDLQTNLKNTHWVGTHFSITMPSYKGSDSTLITEANESNWQSVLKGNPSKIHLKNNNDYSEEHFDINNNSILKYEGTWSIEGDSLFFDIQKPHTTKHTYSAELDASKSTLKLSRKSDFDRDKQIDDQQVLTFKKQ